MKNVKKCCIALGCLLFMLLSCRKSESAKQSASNSKEINEKRLGATPPPTAYSGQVSSAIQSGRVIDIGDSSADDGALVEQMDWMSLSSQKWTAYRVTGNWYKIINLGSGKALTSPEDNAGTQLIQSTYTGVDAQLWKITSANPGQLYSVTNKNGLVVSLNNPEAGNGAIITQEVTSGDASQQWFIQRLFNNPVMGSGADPWVVQRNGWYYYTKTTGGDVQIWKTKRMSKLKSTWSRVAWTPPKGQMYSNNLWAPEMHYLDGKWYIYVAADNGNDGNHRMYVIENPSDDPTMGTWTLKGKITDPSDIWAIDGTVFEHEGKRYFIWSGWRFQNGSQSGIQQLYIAEMSNPWTITGERHMISEPTYDWEKVGLVNEGPEILKNAAGDVFLIYSASGCWTDEYKLGMMKLTGTDPLQQDSWTKNSTPVFQKNIANSVFAPGHNGFFKSPDGKEDWIIYHANAAAGQGCGGSRSTRMQPFRWNEDGTPNFGTPKPITEAQPAPSGEGL
ncbi:hypothetical protein DJ568_07875 [Mucilaginibacter hurinus]|uniref:Ricin B lectin domain-containing protein n=1 Tax=Mucilaginibacter hurinus TaxID=2201324 RepID=A0A367GP71_9SPHI|nr:family 43 glycosylhydrolase [Mucilaginibacter hurinus]RCH55100.1 hypothetical protein DJ568_07875 [Mucilaginibacter hurinus]